MVFHLLPETIFGQDTDDVLAYATPKVAYVRDRYVGALYYILVMMALCWVLGGQVLWRNEHFLLKDVKGIPRMFITHPTKNQCDPNTPSCLSDFKSLSELPYCNEYAGKGKVAHPAKCHYADKHTMFSDGTLGSQVFVPTSMVVIEEKLSCKPSATNKFSCANEYEKVGDDKGYYFNETQMNFYANVEDYTIQFTSTYHREHIAGTSLDHPGFFEECFDKDENKGKHMSWKDRMSSKDKPCQDERTMPVGCIQGIECNKGGLKTLKDLSMGSRTHKDLLKGKMDMIQQEKSEDVDVHIPGVSTARRALRQSPHASLATSFASHDKEEVNRPTPDVYASTWGDTFKLGKLMALAGIDVDNHYNMDGHTARMAGTIIEVEATYTNLRKFLSSFGLSQVMYSYRVKERKLPYVSRESLHPQQPDDFPKSRRYLVQHGILLDFKVGGEFGFFSIVYLLIMLTTSMALLATAHKITDLTSLYLHPRKKNYFHLKYEVSADFSDMWMCDTCGFYNHGDDLLCKGLDKWESPSDTPVCGCDRPEGWTHPVKNERKDDNAVMELLR